MSYYSKIFKFRLTKISKNQIIDDHKNLRSNSPTEALWRNSRNSLHHLIFRWYFAMLRSRKKCWIFFFARLYCGLSFNSNSDLLAYSLIEIFYIFISHKSCVSCRKAVKFMVFGKYCDWLHLLATLKLSCSPCVFCWCRTGDWRWCSQSTVSWSTPTLFSQVIIQYLSFNSFLLVHLFYIYFFLKAFYLSFFSCCFLSFHFISLFCLFFLSSPLLGSRSSHGFPSSFIFESSRLVVVLLFGFVYVDEMTRV